MMVVLSAATHLGVLIIIANAIEGALAVNLQRFIGWRLPFGCVMALRMHAVSSVSGFLTNFAIVVDSLVLVVLLKKIQVLIRRAHLMSVAFHAALDGRDQLLCDKLRLCLVYLAVA